MPLTHPSRFHLPDQCAQSPTTVPHHLAPKSDVIRSLRQRILEIERRHGTLTQEALDSTPRPAGRATASGQSFPAANPKAWNTGCGALDYQLGWQGLELAAVHEIKPAMPARDGQEPGCSLASSVAAARSFALALTRRRLALLPRATDAQAGLTPDILVCSTLQAEAEYGRLYGPGLCAYGIDPRRLLIVTARRTSDALWAIEEGLRSSALSAVIGQINDVALTPARRLALAAGENETPCLLITHQAAPATGATATRWRIVPAASGRHPFVAAAPGAARLCAELERCRNRPPVIAGAPYVLEWCDEAFRFGLAAEFRDRASAPASGTGSPWDGAGRPPASVSA